MRTALSFFSHAGARASELEGEGRPRETQHAREGDADDGSRDGSLEETVSGHL